jgi:Ca2+-binding RTX toxin-like protein
MQSTKSRRTAFGIAAAATSVAAVGVTAVASYGQVVPGTPAKDVHVGLDNDNANNTFIQPPGVTAKQHMDNTDLLFGRDNDDLLIGRLGSDTVLAGLGHDILVGGPERGTPPNSDVLVGDYGNDINIWAPGDGSEVFTGDQGYDTQVFAPFVTKDNGDLKLEWYKGRKIPRVDIDEQPAFSCEIVKVPAAEKLGVQFLARFKVNGNLTVTVRQKDVEKVFCPSPDKGYATYANLKDKHPVFKKVKLANVGGVLGKILAP